MTNAILGTTPTHINTYKNTIHRTKEGRICSSSFSLRISPLRVHLIFSTRSTIANMPGGNIDNAVSLNAMALHLMCQGRYRHAQLTLRKSLEELKHWEKVVPAESTIEVCPRKLLHKSKAASCQIFARPFGVELMDRGLKTTNSGYSFISEHDLNLLSATILFNIALVHQLKGSLSAHTRKASSFYRLAMSTCQRTDVHREGGISLLAVAIGNNLASCFAELFLYQELETCIEWTLDTAEQRKGGCSFFWTNLVSWQSIEFLTAGAA